ncbi:MAG: monovalent cation/H(+) antiporter subunit G [Lachnospiraceae bacterium]|nr:monovalent cation/H(+) antiporter subunit G [Lachnospiraceae bacterium]MCI7596902.1 monovalent cation/H(+) antiporter subunit G [Lachnospiraceae bacterium]MDD7050101.1 monovalent cation/H(+) antiporter subunit G [Lachnospiraceae bacterium]MDY3221633.1 monovalent cation/H(+) antiporter subunit G [Lachnospiraceae bacterium]MDY4097557.1 monovalent cation/H(+) antiporter subunit G [Lachnospiraceae bacterium]
MQILEWLRFAVGALILLSGLFLFGIEVFGSYRFRFVLNRMHSAAIGDTLGIGLCMLGLMIFNGLNLTSVKILLVIIFLWFASPVSSHLIARFEVTTNEKIKNYCEIEEEPKEE